MENYGVIAGALRRPPAGSVHLVPFVPAGLGGLETTRAVLPALAAAGAGVIEVGIAYSDPIADGPVIQRAYHRALEAGVTLEGVLEAVAEVRGRVGVPMVAMVSYSVAYRRGEEEFCRRLREAGFDGVLCPDLPPPGAAGFCEVAKVCGLEPVLLVAPGTPGGRRDEIGRLAGGFIYYLSVAGTTGERESLPAGLAEGVADMKQRTELPVCVGFGISRPEHLRQLAGIAEGAIVGSGLVRRMEEHLEEGPEATARAAAALARELAG